VRRRAFIAALGGAAAWPVVARAQQPERMWRIAVLVGVKDDVEGQARLTAFRKGMNDLGWSEGRNIQMDIRFTDGEADRAEIYADELVKSSPDAILANTGLVVRALQKRTKTIPIVFAQVIDPVGSGFVDSLAHPGGNVTGFVSLNFSMGAKWVETLKEIAPRVTRIGVLREVANPGELGELGVIQAASPSFGVETKALDARDPNVIEGGLTELASKANSGLIVLASPATSVHHELIAALATRLRLPTIYPYPYFVESGGLISYGIDNHDLWRRAADYMDRVLKGANPAELPVQEPTKFVLAINLKTAKALGVTVPSQLLARANEIIE
jgi:putative ABC transport system substrate-binding protein